MIELFRFSSQEIAERLKGHELPVYVLVNPIEYHGPHLSLYNDALLSRGLAQKLHQRFEKKYGEGPCYLLSDVAMGVDPAPGPGTVYTSYQKLAHHLMAVARGILKLEVKRVAFMTFHGAPLHSMAIQKAVRFLRKNGVRAYNPFNIVLKELLFYERERFAHLQELLPEHADKETIMSQLNTDYHGGLFETSIATYLCPESVHKDYQQLPDCPEFKPDLMPLMVSRVMRLLGLKRLYEEFRYAANALGWTRLDPHPGYTGWPGLARPEIGEYFVEQRILPQYVRSAEETLWGDQNAPDSIMKWSYALTLGGRIFTPEN